MFLCSFFTAFANDRNKYGMNRAKMKTCFLSLREATERHFHVNKIIITILLIDTYIVLRVCKVPWDPISLHFHMNSIRLYKTLDFFLFSSHRCRWAVRLSDSSKLAASPVELGQYNVMSSASWPTGSSWYHVRNSNVMNTIEYSFSLWTYNLQICPWVYYFSPCH